MVCLFLVNFVGRFIVRCVVILGWFVMVGLIMSGVVVGLSLVLNDCFCVCVRLVMISLFIFFGVLL